MNRTWLYTAFTLTTLLLALHLYALESHLYWFHRWFDIPMHMLGGVAIGAFLMAFGTARRTGTYFLLMLGVVIFWEVFEYFAHISTGQPGYWIDTIKDIVDGLVGSAITLFIARKTSWR